MYGLRCVSFCPACSSEPQSRVGVALGYRSRRLFAHVLYVCALCAVPGCLFALLPLLGKPEAVPVENRTCECAILFNVLRIELSALVQYKYFLRRWRQMGKTDRVMDLKGRRGTITRKVQVRILLSGSADHRCR